MTTARERAALALLSAPTVHSNGTSRVALFDGYMAAITALQDALPALNATAPNGRDYYPQGDSAIHGATFQHRSRVSQVENVIAQLTLLAEAVQE